MHVNIQSYSFFSIECNNSFEEAFDHFDENFQDIIFNLKHNFFSDIVSVYVNKFYKSISYENKTILFQCALNSNEILIDINNKKLINPAACKKKNG